MAEPLRGYPPQGVSARRRRKARAAKAFVTEAHVQQTVVQFLELDGWRAIRTDPVSDRSRGKGFGEVGMPDYLFVRYLSPEGAYGDGWRFKESFAEVLWIEFKRPGQKPDKHQLAWHAAERARGALVFTVGEGADWWERFTAWYKASGLARRIA